ncbi:hypothetical protein GOODEAATRI_009869 [Goodea atripinnis]|uniref:Secreted protein n=1 Tax=Goodea atripinnis TaxID=208336 RepID=A0ABV0PCX5_9TELE
MYCERSHNLCAVALVSCCVCTWDCLVCLCHRGICWYSVASSIPSLHGKVSPTSPQEAQTTVVHNPADGTKGSTESCNNAEEEEMKGRKGTCPTFTFSACFF